MRLLALVLVLPLLASTASCKRRTPVTRGPEPLTQKYASKNGMLTVRYPASFAAKALGEAGVIVSHNLGGGNDEGVSFMSIEKPITDDLEELARVIMAGEASAMKNMKIKNTTATTCNGNPGIETRSTFSAGLGGLVEGTRSACVFLHGGHAYSFAWVSTSAVAAEEEPRLRAIREAAQLDR